MTKKSTDMAMSVGELISPNGIAEIEALVRKSEARFEIVPLPPKALPSKPTVAVPGIGVIRDGNGDVTIHDLSTYMSGFASKPVRRKGTAHATTLDSFCALVNRHKSPDTVTFADANWKAPRFTAVIDYNAETTGPVPAVATGEDSFARFGQHRVAYAFPLSEAWKVWIAFDGKPMTQEVFAQFLEDHIHEVASPDQSETNDARDRFKTTVANPSDLMDLARGMEILVGARIKSRQNLASGEKELVFETEHKTVGGEKLVVPGLFVVNVAPFYQGEAMRIFARLRYRPSDGGVVWFYELYRPDLAIEERVTADLITVAERTERPTFHGSPET
jgi:uncharacterized protein YfdQ (DUF2303 family)